MLRDYDLIKLQQDLDLAATSGPSQDTIYLADNHEPTFVLTVLADNLTLLNQPQLKLKAGHFFRRQLFRILDYQSFTYEEHYQLLLKYLELAQVYQDYIQTELNWVGTIESWRFLSSLVEASARLNFSHFRVKVDLLTAFHAAAVTAASTMTGYDGLWAREQVAKIKTALTTAKAEAC